MTGFREIFESRYTWIEGFMRNVRRYPGKTAMIYPDKSKTWNYKELNADVNRLVNALASDGFKKQDVVMIQLMNCPEFAFAYVAAQKINGVCCPASFRLSAGELAYNIDDSKPLVFIFDAAFQDTVAEALSMASHKPKRIVIVGGESDEETVSYADYVKDASPEEPVFTCDYNIYDETTRLYTSGTTGRPKAVSLTSINEVLAPSPGRRSPPR